jgi:MFS transporter, DHA1 family, putative efflux transporter
MNKTWKIYLLTLVSFLVGTSQFIIVGILDIGFLTLLGIFAVARTIPSIEGEASMPLLKQFALLKSPKIAIALIVTLFVFVSYSVVNTYITPFLTSVMLMGEQKLSIVLFALGIASLIGSKIGGFLSDKIGTTRTLVGSMIVQSLALALLSIISATAIITIPLLMFWTIDAWTFGPTQNFNLISLAPVASGIMLSLNSSFVQLGFAMGAGIGGITVGGSSIMAITWIGAISVAFAAIIAFVSLSVTRSLSIAQR